MSKLVSIIIPIYNVEKYLNKCIDSVLSQTYKNIEVILVNDGSKDDSLKICKQYEKKDLRIKLVDKVNGGLSDARNHGIKIANGDYLFFLDGDDFIDCDMIEFLVSIKEKYDASISACGFRYYYLNDNTSKRYENVNEEYIKVMTKQEAFEFMLDTNKSFRMIACNKLYDKKVFNNVWYPLGKLYEDVGTTYKTIDNSNKIVYCSDVKYNYVQNPTSITKTYNFNEREFNRIEMANEMCNYIEKQCISKRLQDKLELFRTSQYISVINVMIRSNKHDKKLIKETKKHIKNNLITILKYATKKQKIQFLLLLLNFKLYKIVFKKINKLK